MNEPKRRGSKTTLWKPGVSANPSGRPKEDPRIRAFRETTYQMFIDALQRYGSFTDSEIKEHLESNLTQFERLFATMFRQAAEGDDKARQILIDRLFGKVKEQIDFSVKIKAMSDNELITLGEQAIKVLKGATLTIDVPSKEEKK